MGLQRVRHDWATSFFFLFFIYLDFCVSSLFLHLCSISLPFFFFLCYYVWGFLFPGFKGSWILFLKKVEFFLPFGFCPLRLVQWFVWDSYRVRFVLSFCLFVFPPMSKAEWGGNPVCWWLYFCFVSCLDEASCTGCYWWLGGAKSCIQVVSFILVLTTWYSLGLILW